MANFIPNFNAPSQNYGNILNMSYRRGMDPRKRRRRVRSAAPEGTRVETNPDGTQVSTTRKSRRLAENLKSRQAAQAAREQILADVRTPVTASDILMSPDEMRMRDRAGAMRRMSNMRFRGTAPSSWMRDSAVMGDLSELMPAGGLSYSRLLY